MSEQAGALLADRKTGATAPFTGGCQCGAVRYALSAVPGSVTLCHCRMCQKASGGPFMAFAAIPLERIEWTSGLPKTFRSSSYAERGFCEACGTPLTYQHEGGWLGITLCSLDNPALLPPRRQFGIEARLPWIQTLDALPGETTQEWMARDGQGAIVNYQHPDHDV